MSSSEDSIKSLVIDSSCSDSKLKHRRLRLKKRQKKLRDLRKTEDKKSKETVICILI